MNDFRPKILIFQCNWCAYTAGQTRALTFADDSVNVRIIKVFCSGMVDPSYVTKALASGADGVMIAGCSQGNCHYFSGNEKTQKRSILLKKLLQELGVEPERFRCEWISHDDAGHYNKLIMEMKAAIQKLGPMTSRMSRSA